MFIVTWLFDKLGYMPKINMEVGVIHQAWPFPVEETAVKKPRVKKTRPLPSKATKAKTARTKKVK